MPWCNRAEGVVVMCVLVYVGGEVLIRMPQKKKGGGLGEKGVYVDVLICKKERCQWRAQYREECRISPLCI